MFSQILENSSWLISRDIGHDLIHFFAAAWWLIVLCCLTRHKLTRMIECTVGCVRQVGRGGGEWGVAAVTEIDLGLVDRRTGCI